MKLLRFYMQYINDSAECILLFSMVVWRMAETKKPDITHTRLF